MKPKCKADVVLSTYYQNNNLYNYVNLKLLQKPYDEWLKARLLLKQRRQSGNASMN